VTAQLPLRAGPPPGAPDSMAPVIETAALTKRYPAGVTALDSLTVSVGPGITGLVGANGAGKSTLIKILLGLLPVTSGRAAVLGLDCAREPEQIRMLTGYMPEHDCLPPDVTATEFVTHLGRMSGLPPTVAKERAAESLRHVGLYEERYRQIGTYSTGMKQRVKLAQALVGDPRLLLLDEPTIGLDPAGRASMLDLVSRIGAEFGISIVVSSHLLGEIEQICDHLVAIDGGRLLRADTMTSFTQVSQVLVIEVDEGTADLEAELAARGLRPQQDGRALLVQIETDATYDTVRNAVADLGLPLNRMEQRRSHVAELFTDNQEAHRAG
jgi:ABC-2 type transport system ATP-binding protein